MSSPAPRPSGLARLWHHATDHRSRIIRATVFSVLHKVLDLAPPVLIGLAVDIVVQQEESFLAGFGITEPRDQVLVLGALTFGIWTFESLFEYLLKVEWRNLAQAIQHDFRIDAYTHVQDLEMAYFEDRSTGGLMAILNDDVNQLERFLDEGAHDVIEVVATVLLIGAAFVVVAPSVAWMAFLPIPIILWGSFRFQRLIEPRYAAVRAQNGVLNGQLSNNLGGIATIKSFTAEEREVRRIEAESHRYADANRRAILLSSAFSPLIRIVILVGFSATLVFGGFLALDGGIGVGAYSVMVFLTQRLLWPLTRLGQTFDLYQRAMASTHRILDLLETEPGMEDGDRELPTERVRAEIAFRNVDFAYNEGFAVLSDVALDIPAGETIAFVGATGSGKTTLIKLLFRFYDVDGGAITLGGVDLRSYRIRDLRRALGLVSQDVFLFHGTVAENISYGKPDATMDEIAAAASIAEADQFIGELPEGYDTVVGERGQKLSGGQRQRISIARAVLTDPPVLVLDEATSAVDNETEAAIQRSLERISVDRTTIVIAHRLSTIRHADRIYVLDRGRVVESGTHEELVARVGLYNALWDVQTGEAVPWHIDRPAPST